MKKSVFKKREGGTNETSDGKGFYVSFNNNPCAGSFFANEKGSCETALKRDGGEWLILDGDFRKEYSKLIPKGYKYCKEFYKTKKDKHRCSWSTD